MGGFYGRKHSRDIYPLQRRSGALPYRQLEGQGLTVALGLGWLDEATEALAVRVAITFSHEREGG